ncbi:DUF5789 family protein [Halopelagius inordinatus]|nr:DUF2795 domain-containing protein [Halopelagius inordinatus]
MRTNRIEDAVSGYEFPATSAEIIDAFGDERIELANGSETVGDVLGRMGAEVYDGPRDVHDAVLCGLGHEAVGRRYYSDRDAPSPGETGPTQVSF